MKIFDENLVGSQYLHKNSFPIKHKIATPHNNSCAFFSIHGLTKYAIKIQNEFS